MTRLKTILFVVLLAQLALAMALYVGSRAPSEPAAAPLLAAATVDRIRISDAEQSITLAYTDNGWIVPEADNAAADNTRIEDLLDRLRSLRLGWPIADTPSSHERFEVARDRHQRHVQLFADEQQVAEFWLGTSPGFRQTHLRRADDNAVYAVKLSSFELPLSPADWQATPALQQPEAGAEPTEEAESPDAGADPELPVSADQS